MSNLPVRGIGAYERLLPGMKIRHVSGYIATIDKSAGEFGIWINYPGGSGNTTPDAWRRGLFEIVEETYKGPMFNLKHRDELLSDLSNGLKAAAVSIGGVNMHRLSALIMRDADILVKMNFVQALDYVVNDIYWNEECNWSEANQAIVTID